MRFLKAFLALLALGLFPAQLTLPGPQPGPVGTESEPNRVQQWPPHAGLVRVRAYR